VANKATTLPVDPGLPRPYPVLPSDQVARCKPAVITPGLNAKAAWARSELAFKTCSDRRDRLVAWYENLRNTRK
jgi:hypothetical protein